MTRDDFDHLIARHQELVGLVNDLEFQLYSLGDQPDLERVTQCRQAAGTLIGGLRNVLFLHDQQVLPFVEARLEGAESMRFLRWTTSNISDE